MQKQLPFKASSSSSPSWMQQGSFTLAHAASKRRWIRMLEKEEKGHLTEEENP